MLTGGQRRILLPDPTPRLRRDEAPAMQMETEGGIMARADAHVARIMMDGSRTARRLLAADRTIARAYQRVLLLRQFRAACDAREHARMEREVARELTPSWGNSIRFRVGVGVANVNSRGAGGSARRMSGRAAAKTTSSRRAIRVYQCPLLDSRGRIAIFFRVRYVGLKSKSWRPGLSADHALYILREEALEDGEIVARVGPISSMGETPEEIAACWRALEVAEQGYRANATVQHRIIWNLPHGLTAEQRREMVEGYCERTFGRLGLPYVAAIHKADAKGDQRNYHAHICFSGRPCERVGEGEFEIALEKVTELTDPVGLKRLRALACAHANIACRDAGLSVQFSHLTYKERGIDAKRQRHVGAAAMAAHDRGEKVAAVEHNERVVASNEVNFARDTTAREVALAARLVAVTGMATANAAARTRVAAMRAGMAHIADRARAMAGIERRTTSMTRPAVADLARRAQAMAAALTSRGAMPAAVPEAGRVADLARAARRLADDRSLATDRRAWHVAARSRLAATEARIAVWQADARRQAQAVILAGAAIPYVVREGRLVLDTAGMNRDDAGLVRSLDAAACTAALRERHRRDRERDAAETRARGLALARQREEEERHRRRVEEVCRLLLDTPHRPYRQDGNIYRLDLSRMNETGRTLFETTGTGEQAIADALRQRVERDHRADAFDAMVAAVEKERLFVAPVDGRYLVDPATASRFGVAPDAIDAADAQQRLEAVSGRQQAEMRSLMMHMMAGIDVHGLLDGASATPAIDELDDDALLSELGVDTSPADNINQLRNVRANSERKAAEEIAGATRCEDFATFKPLFIKVQADLEAGTRTTRPFVRDLGMSKAEIQPGEFFILGGQTAYVAAVGEPIKAPNGETDARLRVIYANGTESDLLLRSLQRALYKDDGGRRISEPTAGPLFAPDEPPTPAEPDLLATGTLYVVRSRSTHPTIAAHRDIHKIGITGGSVEARIAGAADDATYLLAGVDVVATYKLYEVNRPRLEALIHRVLDRVRFDVELPDRFGKLVRPREWFLVPLPIIDEIVQRIGDGTLAGMTYDQGAAALTSA